MGNRALRKKAGEAMKAAGFPKRFYRGNRRTGLRYFRARHLRELLYMLSIKPGDLVNDCDAFNHRVKGPIFHGFVRWDDNTYVFQLDQLEFEDGRYSCGCPGGPGPAWTREQIENYMREGFTDESIAESKKFGWWTTNSQKMCEALREGRHICDENGIKLPEFCGELEYTKE